MLLILLSFLISISFQIYIYIFFHNNYFSLYYFLLIQLIIYPFHFKSFQFIHFISNSKKNYYKIITSIQLHMTHHFQLFTTQKAITLFQHDIFSLFHSLIKPKRKIIKNYKNSYIKINPFKL